MNWRLPEKKFWRPFFFLLGEHLRLCPWSLASNNPVLGLERVCPRKSCSWPRIFFVSLALSRAAQPMAREAVLCGPQGLFAQLIPSWKGLLSIFWQIKTSKIKPSSVWFSRNQFGFVAKTFFFIFYLLLGLHLFLGTDTWNTGQSEHRFCTTNLQLFGV